MTSLSNLKLFTTHPHQCSYLEDKQATTLFIDPAADVSTETYSQLADIGFRRSGEHIYRPHCEGCNACIPVRIPVNEFSPTRKFRKIWNRNQDLIVEEVADIKGNEYYRLYEQYIGQRHSDGDMFPPNREQYENFLTIDFASTRFFRLSLGDNLAAVAVADEMCSGLSAMYTFFDPLLSKRSLGSFAILWQIEQSKALNLPYLYLGYWIKDCRKMNYKIDYRPLQLFINDKWLTLT